MEKKRSLGLIVFATLEILIGLLGVWVSHFVVIIDAAYGTGASNILEMIFWGNIRSILAFLILSTVPVLAIISGIGVLKLRNWGRILGIAVASVFLFIALFCNLIYLRAELYTLFFIPLFISILLVCCIYFLTRPIIKEQFK